MAVCWDVEGRSAAQEVVLGRGPTGGGAHGGSAVSGAGTEEVAERNRSVSSRTNHECLKYAQWLVTCQARFRHV